MLYCLYVCAFRRKEEETVREVRQVNQVFLLTVICYIGVSLVLGLISEYVMPVSFIPLMLASQFGLALVPLGYAFRRGHVMKEVGIKPIAPGTAILVIFLMLCLEPFLTLLNAITQCFVETPTTSMIIDEAQKQDPVVMVLIVAVLPAVLEEFVYRGVFFRTYSKLAVFPGAFFSGLLFGAMHGNWNQFVYAFFMGIFFSLTVYATGSLVSSMLMHFVVNGASLAILYLYPKLAESTAETEVKLTVPDVLATYLPISVLGLVLAYFLYRAVAQRCGTWEKIKKEFRRKGNLRDFFRLFTLTLAIGVALMLLLMTLSELD